MKMPIPSDWDGSSVCRWAVCWPDSPKWQAILSGLIEMPSQGRFWDETSGNIIDTQNLFRQFYNENFNLKEVIMACGDTQLSQIAAAIRLLAQNQCCGGATVPQNGGIVQIVITNDGNQATLYGSEPPASLEPGTKPPDYPGTQEQYDTDKCRTAAAIVDGWATSLENLSYIDFAQTTGLTLVILAAIPGIIVLPEFLIPILIAAVIGLTLIGEGLRELAAAIRDDKEEIVCALYTSDSTDTIIAAYADILDALIALLSVSGPVGIAIKAVALILANSSTLNQLFNLSQGQGAAYDCSGCVACPDYSFDPPAGGRGSMTLISDSPGFVNAQAAPNSGILRWDWTTIVNGNPDFTRCGRPVRLLGYSVTSGSIEPSINANARFIVRDNAGDVVYDNSAGVPPTFPIEGYVFTVVSGADFSLSLDWEDL